MVMEHVESYERAYSNIYDLLRPGGISLAFHPVYYALPFVINTVLPEHMTQKMLARVFPNRNVNDIPKFPAHYSGCRISRHVRGTLSDRSEEHTSELQSLLRISYAVFCLKKKNIRKN